MNWHCWIVLLLQVLFVAFGSNDAVSKDPKEKRLSFLQHSKCTYSYEVAVHIARGFKSTESDGFQVHALVDVTSVSREHEAGSPVHLYKLDVREPRLRRVLFGRVINNYPVNHEFEEQLSKPFYFRQKEHGTVVDVLFPKAKESPEVAAFKKVRWLESAIFAAAFVEVDPELKNDIKCIVFSLRLLNQQKERCIAGSFQLNLRDAHKSNIYEAQEHDDSGIFRAKYSVVSVNDTHAHLHRTWTNFNYQRFADSTPTKAEEQKVQSQHSAHVHIKDGRVEKVYRTTSAFLKPANGHPRAENFKEFEQQDIEISTSGYNKLTLKSCSGTQNHRLKRSTDENQQHFKSLTRDSLLFDDTEKIKWSKIGGAREGKKTRSLHEVLRCFVDKSIKEREIGYCANELHHMVRSDESVFEAVKRLVQNRNHQNLTSWIVYVGALAAHGKSEAQDALADAVKSDGPQPLTIEEYKALLMAIFYLPEGPLHCNLFNALFELVLKDEKDEDISASAMLVLAGLAKRAKKAGYNNSLSDSVVEMIHHRYRNRSSLYHPDSEEYESHLRDHIWAFGNVGHHSGLPVILEHIDHDNSDIRSAVISAMRKLSPQYTDHHLLRALYHDEHSEVKAAVVNVLIHRHQDLTDSVVHALEHALWHAEKDETLDSSIQEFLENHGNHTKAVYLRAKRSIIHRRKRALIPELRPREFNLGRTKRWGMGIGGQWLGAETAIQFSNRLQLRVGIFGGKFEVNLDNYAFIRGHILKFPFDVMNGKAAFKSSASFKNDFPKDLIHVVADTGDELLRQFDSITSVITEQIAKFRAQISGYVPIDIDNFVKFVTKLDQFLRELTLPLRALKGTSKIFSFSKILNIRAKEWTSLMDRSTKIQENLERLTELDAVFHKALGTLDKILDIIDGISKYLPSNLPKNFKINSLLQTLSNVTVEQQTGKIKEYFMTLGSPVPEGFSLQFPFKFSIYFSISLEKFQDVLLRLQSFSNKFLEMTYFLHSLESTELPTLSLPFLQPYSPTFQGGRFNFGLAFDWKASLRLDLKLKSQDFQDFLALLKNLGNFLNQFKHSDFDLETFFQEILPGGKFDLQVHFPMVHRSGSVNSSDPSDLLQRFISRMNDTLDLHLLNVSAISHTTDFFRELGPAVTQFAEQSIQKTCQIRDTSENFSHEFKEFGERKGLVLLQEVRNMTENVLLELLNLTITLDKSMDDINKKFADSSERFASDSLQDLTNKMKNIQNLAGDVVNLINGSSSKVNGVCSKASAFSANVIDEVQNNSRQTLNDLTSVIGPVATNVKAAGLDLKSAVIEVESWYEENLAARVGKLSRISQLTRDFLSIVNKKEGFVTTVRAITSSLHEVLEKLRNLPEYAIKARKTADELINFANEAQNYKDEFGKLDVRKQIGIDFDERIKHVCAGLKAVSATTLGKIRSSDFVEQFQVYFKNDAAKLVDRALPKLKSLKVSVEEIRREIQNANSMVGWIIVVLQDLKPFTHSFAPILDAVRKLPDCQKIKKIFFSSTKPCVQKALEVGGFVINWYKDLQRELAIFYELIPQTWKNFKIQRCVRGVTCISKAFIEQGKVVKIKVDTIRTKLEKASEYTEPLKKCKEGVNNLTAVMDDIKLLLEQVRNFSSQDDFKRVKTVLQKITGRRPEEEDKAKENQGRKRLIRQARNDLERIADYLQKAKELGNEIHNFQINTFRSLRGVYEEALLKHVYSLKSLRSKVELSYQLGLKTKKFDSSLKSLNNGTTNVLAFVSKLQGVSGLFSNQVVTILDEAKDLNDVVKPHLNKYATPVSEVTGKVNRFLDEVSNFLDKIQTRQRGLDPSAYKPWQDIPYCSEEVCLRSIRRSSSSYLSEIFTWKFPHLDDLSSMQNSGRWLTPGLFDDYKVEGITQLSANEMILGMRGVASNKGKASLLVVTNFDRGVKKIILLTKQGSPLAVNVGGVVLANDYIWISDGDKNEILSVRKDHITSTFSFPKPSKVDISKTVLVEGNAESVSFDQQSNFLWVADGIEGKAYGYKLSPNGDLAIAGIAPDRVIHIGKNAQGMAIVRQFGKEYACISRCTLMAGFQCKLEFHDLSNGDETGENSLARVVRTPSGLESVSRVDNEVIAVAFSSGTFTEKENIELVGGEFEDRYFKLRLPILSTTFGIHENCLYFKVVSDYVVRPKRIFPVGKMICGTSRKRSISQELLETDVYHEKLENIHKDSKRVRRSTAGLGSCEFSHRGTLLRGFHDFYRYWTIIPVFGIPVLFVTGASGHYSVGYQGSLCLAEKTFAMGLIPGAWISVYASASVPLILVEAGVTIEARILETYLVPELRLTFQRWPLKACLELRLIMTPLSIRVYLWYRFSYIYIDCWLFGCDIGFRWGSKRTFKEWWWSARQIDRILFTNCKKNIDSTPPVAGKCTARQVADTKYFVQWDGFREDTKMSAYHIRIGSIKGSGDDYSSWVGTSLSQLVKNLRIMHGRDVFVSVMATNDAGGDSPLAFCPLFQARRIGPQIRYVYDGSVVEQDTDYQSDTFSLGMNFAFKSDFNQVVSLKWGVSSHRSCTFDESEADIVLLTSLGDSSSIQVSDLKLEHGKMYFTRLHAMDTFGLKAVMCSDGIMIDTTQPIPTYFQDGAGEGDAKFIPSLRRVRGKFDPFVDPESPMVKYEWKIVKNETGEDVTDFVNVPLTQRTPLMDGLALEAGSIYKLALRGTNAAGLQAVIETNGFIPDNTPLFCEGQVIDVTNEKDTSDFDFVRELNSIQAKWRCFDRESGISSELVGVGTYPGGDDIRAFEEVRFLSQTQTEDEMSYVQFSNITILKKVRYYVTVKVTNGAGLKKTMFSDGILIDLTPPTVSLTYIRDGVRGKDKNFSREQFSFSAHWEQAFADAESGVSDFRVGLGTKPGLADIKSFTMVGSETNVTITGLLLVSGQSYFVTIVGCNGVEMCVNGSSNGATVDFVPPHSGTVFTGLSGPPTFYQWVTNSVWARWRWCLADERRRYPILNSSRCTNDSFYDVHSGIDMFGISVISQRTDQLLAPYKLSGRHRLGNRIIYLQDGIYSVAIEATDKAGVTARGLSNTLIVDSSPPVITLVQHGHFGETLEYTNTLVITFRSYFVIEDELSNVKAYKIGVGSYSGADDIIKFQSFTLGVPATSMRANWTSPTPTSLRNNQRYFITLFAINSAGLFTVKSSASLLSDFDAPKNGVVLDGWGLQDAGYQSFTSLFRAHWYGFTDFSGIDMVFMGLTSKSLSNVCDVKKEEIVPSDKDFHVLSGLSLISGQMYYACLKLVDKAGNFASFRSSGVMVDTTPPLPGYVADGKSGLEIDAQIENLVLTASWSNFTDPETRIVSYKLAFGSSPGGQDVQEFTNVGNVTKATSSTLKVAKLTTGRRYYATVIAYNVLGMPSSMVSSNGVIVDFTGPLFSLPARDGDNPNKDLKYTSESSLKATWNCEDPETGLSNVEIAFGLQPGDKDIMDFLRLPVSQTSFIAKHKLRLAYRYFATVRCTNKLGLTAVSYSDGVVYDDSPPKPVYVRDGDYQDSNKTLVVSFKFVDTESSIQAYHAKVWKASCNNSVEVNGFFSFGGNVTKATLDLSKELVNGIKYYINITAVNNVGLKSTKQSDGFLADTTSPVCSKIWDGKGDYRSDVEYAPSSNTLIISWVCKDIESPIVQLRIAVKDLQTDKYTIPFYSSKTPFNSSGSVAVAGDGQMPLTFEEGHRYASGIEVVNAVGLNATYWTNGVMIDSTPPLITHLRLQFYPKTDVLTADWLVGDKESGLKSVFWGLGTIPETNDIRNLTEVAPSIVNISVSTFSFRQGITCFLNIFVDNKAGLSSKSSSNAIIIDRSPPNPGTVAAHYAFPQNYNQSWNEVPNSSFVVTWTGFSDPESGTKKIRWAVGTACRELKQGTGSMYTEVEADDSVGGTIIGNQTLVGNKTYFVSVRVTNGAGLSRTDCSPGIHVVLGKLSAGVVSDGPINSANDIDFQLDDKAIWAHWRDFKDPVFGIARYKWCIRDLPPSASGSDSCAWPYVEVHHLKTKASRFYNLTLVHGKKYYVTVKAENTRGDTVMSSSDGVLVDRTLPIGKSLQISPLSGKETLFLTSPSPPVVTWSIDDPECGMSHFYISAGSFPFQDDLLSSQRVDSLSRSFDLNQVNLTLYEGLRFYVTVTGVNMLGLETTLTSQQIVVDWTPPESGKVLDGNRTLPNTKIFIDSDYQQENKMLIAHWSGFRDNESDVVEYQWCIGRTQGTCEEKTMTSAGLHKSVSHSMTPQEGVRYFVTIEATNGAGLKKAIYSDGIIVDTSPPVLREVHFGVEGRQDKSQLMIQKDGNYLFFHWDKVDDAESGISSVEWCAGTSNNSCNIVALTAVSPEATSVKHYMCQSLAPGTSVFVFLLVTNGAEMTTTAVTGPLVIDTTPPITGYVTVGQLPGTTYFKKGDSVNARWQGFLDGESNLSHYEMAVCQASAKKCLRPYLNAGLRTTLDIDILGVNFGVSYVVTVRAFNKAGLFSEATSNQFIVNGLNPSAGIVYDGLDKRKDIEFQSSVSQLSASWSPFTDVNGRIAEYELCAGTKQGTCDVSDFVSVGMKLLGTIIGLSLIHDERYFVTVRATSESGYSITASSNGVRVDSTPPVTGKVRDGETLLDINYQADDTYIFANWDEFHDKESGVTGYTWCAGTGKGFCDIISPTYVADQTSARQQVLEPLPAGIAIFVTVGGLNNAGTTATVYSDGFKIDNTGPSISRVLDLQLGLNDDDIDYLISKDSYCVRWDAVAPESGILKSEISVCFETDTHDCLLLNLDVGNQTFICVADLEFQEGIKYVTRIRAENYVGVSSEMYSDGFVLESTPPLMGEIFFTEVSKSTVQGALEHFTHSIIAVQWRGFWDKESGVQTSYVCVGTNSEECNVRNFTAVRNSTSYTFSDLPLVQGETYFVSVKVENAAGLISDIKTSDGIVVDKTGPINQGTVLDGDKDGEDVDIQHSRILIAAHWSAFEDLESDVVEVTWCAGYSSGICDLVKETQLNHNSTSVRYFLSKPIMNGQRYYVTVKATNGAGVTSSLTSDGVTVDDTPPIAGTVIDGLERDVNYVNGEDDISASWFAFMDLQSGIDSYEVALCQTRNLSNCPQLFTSVGKTTNVTIAGLDLESGVQYLFIVRAINSAGLKVEASSNGITVDFTPPIKRRVWIGAGNEHVVYLSDPTKMVVSWMNFVDLESSVTKYEVCVSSDLQNCSVTTFVDVELNKSFTVDGLHLAHGTTYFAIVRGTNGIGLSTEVTSDGVLIDLTLPIPKDDKNVSPPRPSNQTNFNVSLSQPDLTKVSTYNKTSSPITFRCLEEYVASSWEEFEDSESGILRYDWCVGTANALCDVVSIRSVGMKTRGAAIVNRLHSGTILFSTVYAINGAKLRRQVISKPCTIIAVAPKVTEVIDVSSFNTSNFTDIDWKATMQSMSLLWNVIGSYLDKISHLRVQVAVTRLSSNRSVPRLLQEKSWNGEPLEQPFMDVLSHQRNVTIRSVAFQPWERYRGIVRVWNEGGVFSEASGDGLRMEPSPPPTRALTIRDKAAENEHLRWWPNLRIPPVNKSVVDSDITSISSPAKLELTVSSATSNATANRTESIVNHNMFSPTAAFEIIVKRVTNGINDTNSTSDSRTMKVIPGFADLEGPCCAKRPRNTPYALTDTHFKPTLPAYECGVSLAILPNDVVAVGCRGKVVLQSLKNQSISHTVTLDDQSDPNAIVNIASHQNTTGFLVYDKLYLYKRKSRDPDDSVLGGNIIIGNCKSVSARDCPIVEKWADKLGQSFALNENVTAVTGTKLSTKSNVVAVFREISGKWMFLQTVGEKVKQPNFGHSISLNENFMAIAAGDGKNCCVFIYSLATLTLRKTVCLSDSINQVAPLSIYLTKTDALVALSKTSRVLKVFQLNMTSNFHHEVCEYRAASFIDELSGNLDVNSREEGFVVAVGFEAIRDGEGVLLLGFQGIYSDNPYPRNETNECVSLGVLISRESGLRADGLGTRTSVSFKGNILLFGIPGVLTWPKNDQWLSTGRVFMATYCPLHHFRTSISGLQSLRPVACLPCERGRKSFGGFTETCTVCKERICFSPMDNESSSFTSGICDNTSCISTVHINKATNGESYHLRNGSLLVSGPEHVYTVELLETTRAGESTVSLSESFLIDATAPVPGVVYDGVGTDQNMNCSENSTFGEHSQCSTRNFEDTDVDYTNNTREVHARWIDFLDYESDIVEYFWCVGSRPMTDDVRVCESTGLRPNGSHYELNLNHGGSYYVTVIACNGARMCSAAHSDGVTIDTTPPVMEYVRDGIMGPDMDYQVFVDIIFAYFTASDLDSGVASYEVAWGSSPGLTDMTDFEELINATIWRAKFKDDALEIGKKYYATVRATNGAGLMSDHLSSNGIVVGKSEYVFDNSSEASFFFDTVSVNDDGTRKDGGVGKTYGTLSVPEGAVEEEVKLRCYSLDEKTLEGNKTEEGPVSDPSKTAPKQFMMGNYSFQIKALDPVSNTVQEGFRFAKPIKLSMFYDVDNLVKANKKHVNNEVTKNDIDPVLYLWDPKNETWFDAKLTCSEPWSHVNRSIKLLEVNVCHLTQFAFFFSFFAQHGLLLFEENDSIYSSNGHIHVSRRLRVTKLEIPVRRSKGSQGDITVQWTLYQNDSSYSVDLIWPKSGKVSMKDGQWNDSFTLTVDDDREQAPEGVIWVQLENPSGGALLASHAETTLKITIASNQRPDQETWIITTVCVCLASVLVLLVASFAIKRHREKTTGIIMKRGGGHETEMTQMGKDSSDADQAMYHLRLLDHSDHIMETALDFSSFNPEAEMVTANAVYESADLTGPATGQGTTKSASNPLYGATSLTGVGAAGAIVNPLYELTASLPGASVAPIAANSLCEATPTEIEITGVVNYGVNDSEDG